jgi:pimeloyl-ACP methyl ester carboxylesterase
VFKVAYFTKKNAKIFYELYGDGENWITLINGYTRPSSDFKLLGSFLAGEQKKVFCFDNRGCGQTEAVLDFSIEEIVGDVVDIWNSLGILQSDVLGISMGGLIAQRLAIAEQSRVK